MGTFYLKLYGKLKPKSPNYSYTYLKDSVLNDKFISWRVDSLTSEVLCLSWVSWELYQTRQHAFFTTHQHLIERQCVFGTPHLPCPILKVCVPAGLSHSVSTLYIFAPDFCLKLTFGFALLCQIILSPCIRVTSSPQPRWRNCSAVKWRSAKSIKTHTNCNFLFRFIRAVGNVTVVQ